MTKAYMRYLEKVELLKGTLKQQSKNDVFRINVFIATVSVFLMFLIITSLYCCFGDKHTK